MPKPSTGLLLGLVILSAVAVGAQSRQEVIQVTIDVKPGDEPTTIEPKREGMVPIAILSSKQFDATEIDAATIRAGAKGTEATVFRTALEDVNGDRLTDMMALFRVQDLALECSGTSITVKGRTNVKKDFEGTEKVTMVGCR
jgi:hypothetical protein